MLLSGPNTAECLTTILKNNGIDPQQECPEIGTAFQILERHIAAALDEIEEITLENEENE